MTFILTRGPLRNAIQKHVVRHFSIAEEMLHSIRADAWLYLDASLHCRHHSDGLGVAQLDASLSSIWGDAWLHWSFVLVMTMLNHIIMMHSIRADAWLYLDASLHCRHHSDGLGVAQLDASLSSIWGDAWLHWSFVLVMTMLNHIIIPRLDWNVNLCPTFLSHDELFPKLFICIAPLTTLDFVHPGEQRLQVCVVKQSLVEILTRSDSRQWFDVVDFSVAPSHQFSRIFFIPRQHLSLQMLLQLKRSAP